MPLFFDADTQDFRLYVRIRERVELSPQAGHKAYPKKLHYFLSIRTVSELVLQPFVEGVSGSRAKSESFSRAVSRPT